MKDYVEKGSEINFKHWLSRTILTAIILFILVAIIEQYYQLHLLSTVLLGVTIAILFGLFHECLHYRCAINLGYIPEWYRTRIKFGFDIDTNQKTEEQKEKDSKLSIKQFKQQNVTDANMIGRAPYVVILPLSFLLLVFGFIANIHGVMLGAGATLFLHMISYTKEGKEV